MAGQTLLSHGFTRRLSITLSAFVLLSSLALAAWMKAWSARQELAAFKELAINNAAFVSQLRLPRSPQLARRLATVLDMGVGFHFEEGEEGDWPDGLEKEIHTLVSTGTPTAQRSGGYSLAAAPLSEEGTHLVLVRKDTSLSKSFSGGVLVPAVVLALACGGMGWVLGKRLVQSERLATLGGVATSLAHEIKNPAAAIRLHADLLEQGATGSQQTSASMIRDEADNLTSLVNQWLYVAKASPGKTGRHDLYALLRSEARRLQAMMEHYQVQAEVVATREVWAEVDAMRFSQVLRNLLTNAAQAMPNGGTVKALVEVVGTEVVLSISDQGPGFSGPALQNFGEPFYSEKEGGMGIGLTLAKEVIEAHGGTIHAENQDGGGAVVVCRLPVVEGRNG